MPGVALEFLLPSIAKEEEAVESYFHWYSPKPGDLVFDLGAHAGVSTYACLSQAVGPHGNVFAFEPDPVAWTSLLHNIAALRMHNVHPVQKAVAGKAGKLAFQAEGSLGSALSSVASRACPDQRFLSTQSLWPMPANWRAAFRHLLKMDIEGAELEVVAASQTLLRDASIQFAADTNHIVGGHLTNKRLEDLFRQAGLESESSSESGFLTTWARPDPEHPSKNSGQTSLSRTIPLVGCPAQGAPFAPARTERSDPDHSSTVLQAK